MYRLLFGKQGSEKLMTKIADAVISDIRTAGTDAVVVAEKSANATITAAKINARASTHAAYARAGASIFAAGTAVYAGYQYFKPIEDESKNLKAEVEKLKSEIDKKDRMIIDQTTKVESLTKVKNLIKMEVREDSVEKIALIEKEAEEDYARVLYKIYGPGVGSNNLKGVNQP